MNLDHDRLRAAIKRIDDYSGISREDVTLVARAAEQSLTFRRLPLPEELDEKALEAMWQAGFGGNCIGREVQLRAAYQALYDHLTKPKTKTVQVWRAEYCTAQTDGSWLPQCQQFHVLAQMEERVRFMRENSQWYCLIHESGPHNQEAPA